MGVFVCALVFRPIWYRDILLSVCVCMLWTIDTRAGNRLPTVFPFSTRFPSSTVVGSVWWRTSFFFLTCSFFFFDSIILPHSARHRVDAVECIDSQPVAKRLECLEASHSPSRRRNSAPFFCCCCFFFSCCRSRWLTNRHSRLKRRAIASLIE